MDGKGQTLFWFHNEKVKVEVPFFQRPYVWDEEDWEELLVSINNANKESMPFIGSFILQELEDKYYVIDGQQRITTLTVMIKAYVDTFKELPDGVKSQFLNFIYDIKYHGLQPVYNPRLIPSNIDKQDFDAVMLGDAEKIEEQKGKITEAYKYFVKNFQGNNYEKNIEMGERILTNNKFFITIILDVNDDEQKIFDSVNSLGKDLTNADIIKNYLYQRMKDEVANDPIMVNKILEHHQQYWVKCFYSDEKRAFWEAKKSYGRIQMNNLEAFLKDFAIIKGIYSAYVVGGIEGLAKAYKIHINKLDYQELQQFSKELSEYANCYYTYNSAYEKMDDFRISDLINTTLLIMDKLETSTFNPYILKVIKNSEDDMEEKLFALQKFVLIRFIYKAKTKNYNKVCDTLMSVENPVQYLESYNDSEELGLNEFPVGLKRIYNKPAILILFLLELIRRNGEEAKYPGGMKYVLSLEHIMPKAWEKNWSKVSSFRWQEATGEYEQVTEYSELIENRKNMITSIGNMTLLTSGLNSAIGNAAFPEKIMGNGKYDGYKKYVGSLTIAQDIIEVYEQNKQWDERNIIARNHSIFNELNQHYKFTK